MKKTIFEDLQLKMIKYIRRFHYKAYPYFTNKVRKEIKYNLYVKNIKYIMASCYCSSYFIFYVKILPSFLNICLNNEGYPDFILWSVISYSSYKVVHMASDVWNCLDINYNKK